MTRASATTRPWPGWRARSARSPAGWAPASRATRPCARPRTATGRSARASARVGCRRAADESTAVPAARTGYHRPRLRQAHQPRERRAKLTEHLDHHEHAAHRIDVNGMALSATLHCLTGCAIGEVAGVAIGTALGWSNEATIVLAIALAFLFGYSLTSWPLLRAGLALTTVVPIAF